MLEMRFLGGKNRPQTEVKILALGGHGGLVAQTPIAALVMSQLAFDGGFKHCGIVAVCETAEVEHSGNLFTPTREIIVKKRKLPGQPWVSRKDVKVYKYQSQAPCSIAIRLRFCNDSATSRGLRRQKRKLILGTAWRQNGKNNDARGSFQPHGFLSEKFAANARARRSSGSRPGSVSQLAGKSGG